MIVERLVWQVKPGKQAELVELLLPHLRDQADPIKRIYTPKIGAGGTVVAELEYDNMTDWESAWTKWQSPEQAAEVARFGEKGQIVETTIWDPVE
jgi:hypothetical protein